MTPLSLEIRVLTPALAADYLAFFDRDAFADNPEWRDCYCGLLQRDDGAEAWAKSTAEENRAIVARRLAAGDAEGLLAYVDGRPIAWCQAGVSGSLPGLPVRLGRRPPPDVGCVSCFVVAAPYRRRGIARRLLSAACDHFRNRGLTWIEAYPRKEPADAAHHFPGPPALYDELGFVRVGELENRWVVRKRL